MERLRVLKAENLKLGRQDEETEQQRHLLLSTRDSWRHHVSKMEAEIKRLKEKYVLTCPIQFLRADYYTQNYVFQDVANV